MQTRMLLFLGVMSLVWGLAHLYVGKGLVRPLAHGPRADVRRRALWIVLAACFPLAPLAMGLGRGPAESALLTPVTWAGFVYMGLFFLVLAFFATRDLGSLLVRGVRRLVRSGTADTSSSPADAERRRFLANAGNAGIVGVSGALAGWGFVEARRLAEVVQVEVPIEGLHPALDGYRIVQLSDVHIGPTIKGDYLSAVVDRTNALAPDLVAVTGDLVDGYVETLREHVAPLGRLRATDGTYFVTGNHEYYWGVDAWLAEVRRLGLSTLVNEHRVIERDGARLIVGGCTDYSAHRLRPDHASDPAAAFAGAPEGLRLLLAHQPKSVRAAVRAAVDLQLSGHTHGGQFFPVSLFVGLAHPFTEGLGRLARTWIYVNRGTGYWGPPLRAGVPSEITALTLRRAT